ncbi:aldehyde dehydrogenase family protein [Actinomadura vinacea]|uniref:aldehyde dehydrogenase family protein n=1 Tax=Actinomadura vinacea TaxID=115336 RepID=UPI0031D8AC3F
MRTRVAIIRETPGKFEIVDIDLDDPRQGEIRVKLTARSPPPARRPRGGSSARTLLAGIGNASFMNNSQTCTPQSRILVPRQRYDEVVEAVAQYARDLVVGDPSTRTRTQVLAESWGLRRSTRTSSTSRSTPRFPPNPVGPARAAVPTRHQVIHC